MKLSERTIKAIQKVITGDQLDDKTVVGPYQSGPDLVAFFNEFGWNDTYPRSGGFPSRWMYCEDKLREVNGTDRLHRIIETVLDPRRYIDSQQVLDVSDAVAYLNKYLKYDGYEVRAVPGGFRVYQGGEVIVELHAELHEVDQASRQFMEEQIQKCKRKLDGDDFDGAITNARSLVEAVLVEIERRFDSTAPTYDGNLPKLYKRVQRHMNLDPGNGSVDHVLKPILTGLAGIVAGVASTRNQMSDAHVRSYTPARRHARLAVNAANTLVDFILESYEHQHRRVQPDESDA